MAFEVVDTETADADLASGAIVLTHTATKTQVMVASIKLGDGTKNLSGDGGTFEVAITIGGNTWLGGADEQIIGTASRAMLQTQQFAVVSGDQIVISVTSPNATDIDVAVEASLIGETDAAISTELAKVPRAAAAIPAGAFDMTITGGQDAEVTYSEPV